LSEADRAALAAGMQQPRQAQTMPGAYAQAPVAPVAPVAPQAYAGQGAVGYSGSQGSAGGADATAYAYAPAPAQPVRETTVDTAPPVREPSHPRAVGGSRVADNESSGSWCANCGNVESIRTITTRARGSGLGAGAGAILGGLLGHQVGGGSGRQLATVAGAVGGAVVGNQVEGNMKANHSYEIRVRLDDGTLRTFHQQSTPRWHTGDRVRVVKGALRTA
jgi:outer membrane lipoprotein SlyB